MKFSFSRVSSYLRCPMQHYLGYVKRLSPIKRVRPLTFGSDFHELLEHRYDKAARKAAYDKICDTFHESSATDQQTLGDNYPEDIKQIFLDYCKNYKNDDPTAWPEKELWFEIDLPGGNKFVGKIDELDREPGRLGEHKTFSGNIPSHSTMVMNAQSHIYARALKVLYDIDITSCRWDYVKSSPAKAPIWLEKSERFSTAKTQSVTEFSYLRACKARGVEPDPAALAQYKQNNSNYFYRTLTEINPAAATSIFESTLETAVHIAKHGEKDQRFNITRDCSWCSYQSICYGYCTGADVKHIINTDYISKR